MCFLLIEQHNVAVIRFHSVFNCVAKFRHSKTRFNVHQPGARRIATESANNPKHKGHTHTHTQNCPIVRPIRQFLTEFSGPLKSFAPTQKAKCAARKNKPEKFPWIGPANWLDRLVEFNDGGEQFEIVAVSQVWSGCSDEISNYAIRD